MKPAARALALLGALFCAPAGAQTILGTAYDGRHDALLVTIAYEGKSAQHRFSVLWSACNPDAAGIPEVAGRLVDQQGGEPALKAYRVTQRISLDGLPCRPALLTLRLGRRSLATVDVPPPSTARTARR